MEIPNFEDVSIESNLHGLIEYYEFIFGDEGLFKKECEFRNYKLNLTLDLINVLRIPADITTELRSAIIAAWRLKIPAITREQRTQETGIILECIDRIRYAVRLAKEQPGSVIGLQLDAVVLQSLPLRDSDLDRKDAPKILDLINQAMAYIEGLIEVPVIFP